MIQTIFNLYLPMQKITTPLSKTDLSQNKPDAPLQPSVESIKKILQFAAVYRAEKLSDDKGFVEIMMN
jgi:hypothetical protein